MATFKTFNPEDIKTSRSSLNQLIDIAGEDVSGSAVNTRRKYVHWASSSYDAKSADSWNNLYSVTSSLWQTCYDNDYTLATSNPILDVSVGLHVDSTIVTDLNPTLDDDGLYIFKSTTAQMREKLYMYQQYAQVLLGDKDAQFVSPLNSDTETDIINEALFINVKRLFSRDGMKRETVYFRTAYSASHDSVDTPEYNNMFRTGSLFRTYSDVDSNDNKLVTYGGNVANIYQSNDTDNSVGLVFIDQGILMFDLKKTFQADQPITGTLAMQNASSNTSEFTGSFVNGTMSEETLIGQNYFLASGTIDNILDHVLSSRVANSTDAQLSFQNKTNLNSTLFFCKIDASEFNYSSNPTFIDSEQNIVVIEDDDNDKSFVYTTGIGLYNANNELMAVAKLSRPVLLNDERALTIRVRTDW
jgi:hypothetical protein